MTGIQVIKIGGAALADAGWLSRFAHQFKRNATRIIVHGGGPEVSALSQQLGIEVVWAAGRRITSEAALDVASLVLTGRINKRIVRALNLAGVHAIGLSGEDANLMRAQVTQGGAIGRVGEVIEVKSKLLFDLIELGLVPVISPISADANGGALNINADEAATAIANAVGAEELLFLTDVAAVRDETGDCSVLSDVRARELIDEGVATGGMSVKLNAALAAVGAGIARVRVGSLAMMNDSKSGTLLRKQEAEHVGSH